MRTNDRHILEELLTAAARTRRAFPRGGLGGFELNAVQVLLALLLEPDQTVNQLSEALGLDQSTVSHTVGRLGEELVRARVSKADRRRREQRLTAKGKRTAERLAAEVIGRAG